MAKKIKRRTKLSITIDSEIYEIFDKKISQECLNKSKLLDKLISDWLKKKD